MAVTVLDGGDGLPPEPDWSSIFDDDLDRATAHEHWDIVTRELKSAATLTVANGHSIKRLVEFRVQYERASRHVAEKGAILAPTNKKTKIGQWNPYWSVMRQADDAIRVIEAELGIAPVRRGKAVKVAKKQRQGRAADEFLNRSG